MSKTTGRISSRVGLIIGVELLDENGRLATHPGAVGLGPNTLDLQVRYLADERLGGHRRQFGILRTCLSQSLLQAMDLDRSLPRRAYKDEPKSAAAFGDAGPQSGRLLSPVGSAGGVRSLELIDAATRCPASQPSPAGNPAKEASRSIW